MDIALTKAQLRTALGSDAAVAAFFGISRAAVAQWGDHDPVPELRQLQAQQKRPDLFGPDAPWRRATAVPSGDAAAEADGNPVQPVSEAA